MKLNAFNKQANPANLLLSNQQMNHIKGGDDGLDTIVNNGNVADLTFGGGA